MSDHELNGDTWPAPMADEEPTSPGGHAGLTHQEQAPQVDAGTVAKLLAKIIAGQAAQQEADLKRDRDEREWRLALDRRLKSIDANLTALVVQVQNLGVRISQHELHEDERLLHLVQPGDAE